MVTFRSVSGHVSPDRYLRPMPLCSARVTGRHRSYGHLRLPAATAPPSSPFQACPRVPSSFRTAAGSPWLTSHRHVRLDTAYDPGVVLRTGHLARRTVACGHSETLGQHQQPTFRDSTPSRSALPVTIAPRPLSYLRIEDPVAGTYARLDTKPVASGYLGGIHTRSVERPCQDAPESVGENVVIVDFSPETPLTR